MDTMSLYRDVYNIKKNMKNSIIYTELTGLDIDKSKLHDAMYDVYLTKCVFIHIYKTNHVDDTYKKNYLKLFQIMDRYIKTQYPLIDCSGGAL